MRLKEFVNVLSNGVYNVISNNGIAFIGHVAVMGHDVINKYRFDVKNDEVVSAEVVLFDVGSKDIFIDYCVRKED